MKIKKILLATALTSVLSAPIANSAESFTATQKQELQQMVHDYLVQNPEVLIEASQALQQKQQQNMQSQAKEVIAKNAEQLFMGKVAVAGNPKGDVTLVEFFDYQCGHCKKMKSVIKNLIANNKSLRVIYMEFPIFGQSSEVASRAALAASMQGKYQQLHDELLSENKRLNESLVMKKAESLGLNMTKLKSDMNSDTVSNILKTNRELAEKIKLMGTPAFIVAATPNGKFKESSSPALVPGAASEQTLANLIKNAAS